MTRDNDLRRHTEPVRRSCQGWTRARARNRRRGSMRFSVTKILRYSCHGFRSAGRRTASSTGVEHPGLGLSSAYGSGPRERHEFSAMRATNGSISDRGVEGIRAGHGSPARRQAKQPAQPRPERGPPSPRIVRTLAEGNIATVLDPNISTSREMPSKPSTDMAYEARGACLNRRLCRPSRGMRIRSDACIAVPMLRGSAREKQAVRMNGHDDPEPRHESHHGRAAVAHERKREALPPAGYPTPCRCSRIHR